MRTMNHFIKQKAGIQTLVSCPWILYFILIYRDFIQPRYRAPGSDIK